jgi:hypothetical protein
VGGAALGRLSKGGREERGKGARGQMAARLGERKRKIEIYFEIDIQL